MIITPGTFIGSAVWGSYSIDTLFICGKGPRYARRAGIHYYYPSDTYIVRTHRRNEDTGEDEVVKETTDVDAEELVIALDAVIG